MSPICGDVDLSHQSMGTFLTLMAALGASPKAGEETATAAANAVDRSFGVT